MDRGKKLYCISFNTKSDDGWNPRAALVMGHGGVLYGTTSRGGTSGAGAVFALAPPASPVGKWKETVLYSFSGQNGDGASPLAPLVTDANGSLYGTTESGGASNLGTVFELTPPATAGSPWTETVLHSFTQNGDGAYPYAGLTSGPNGSFYGTTSSGGASGVGTVFELAPPAAAGGAWTESILYSFTGRPVGSAGAAITGDGATPYSGLLMDVTGALYGTTSAGGAGGGGTAFKLTPPSTPGSTWTETVMATFLGYVGPYGYILGPEGTMPAGGLVFGPEGQLYGAAEYGGNVSCSATNVGYGCGTVFEVQP